MPAKENATQNVSDVSAAHGLSAFLGPIPYPLARFGKVEGLGHHILRDYLEQVPILARRQQRHARNLVDLAGEGEEVSVWPDFSGSGAFTGALQRMARWVVGEPPGTVPVEGHGFHVQGLDEFPEGALAVPV